jgi:UDPglucose 6-dehydrogenase
MRICVQGLWHLGTVTAACLASVGHDVIGLDFDEKLISDLRTATPPVFEPGLTELLAIGLASRKLQFINSTDELPLDIELLWIAYDTPVDENDCADVEYVVKQVVKALPKLPREATVLVSSQLPVGSTHRLSGVAAAMSPGKSLGFASSPENLRLGRALDVFLKPDRVVVGVDNERDRERIQRVLAPITESIEWMSVASAEMTKHAINSFLATSVVFANEIASVCELVGADAKEVERGLKSEQRIGPKAYLSPGGAFAGGTLARDIEYLKTVSRSRDLRIPLLDAVKVSNDAHKSWVNRKLSFRFPNLANVVIAVWGLTYKAGTDTLRRSLAVELCDWLLARGAKLRVHDPIVQALPAQWKGRVQRIDDAVEAASGAAALIVGTEWPEYKEISGDTIASVAPGIVVLDANRFLSSWQTVAGLNYVAVGTLPLPK